MTENLVAILERARQNWNKGDHNAYLAFYDPQIVMHDGAGDLHGIAGVRGYYAGIWSAFPDAQLHIDDVLEDGDQLAARFRVHGTHQGDLMGIPATGKDITLSGITIMRFTNGRCIERWTQADFMGLLVQLGVMPGPGA